MIVPNEVKDIFLTQAELDKKKQERDRRFALINKLQSKKDLEDEKSEIMKEMNEYDKGLNDTVLNNLLKLAE